MTPQTPTTPLILTIPTEDLELFIAVTGRDESDARLALLAHVRGVADAERARRRHESVTEYIARRDRPNLPSKVVLAELRAARDAS